MPLKPVTCNLNLQHRLELKPETRNQQPVTISWRYLSMKIYILTD